MCWLEGRLFCDGIFVGGHTFKVEVVILIPVVEVVLVAVVKLVIASVVRIIVVSVRVAKKIVLAVCT